MKFMIVMVLGLVLPKADNVRCCDCPPNPLCPDVPCCSVEK
jgi:hypothetical protein